MSDREFGGNDDLSLPKGEHSYDFNYSMNTNAPQRLSKRLSKIFWLASLA
jgi:hypothetical protein